MPGRSSAAILKCSAAMADYEIRSMLVLRHRHPRLWEAVLAGVVRVWQANKLIGLAGMAGLTVALTVAQSRVAGSAAVDRGRDGDVRPVGASD